MNPYELNLNNWLMSVLVTLGRLLSYIWRPKHTNRLYFFFPYCHVGGAEKVHADIVKSIRERSSVVFFTHRSRERKLLPEFQNRAKCYSLWLIFKYLLPFAVGFVSGILNRNANAVVFGCNSRFFYKLLPYLGEHVKKIDLVHAFGGGSENYSLEVVPFLDRRVVITEKTTEDFRKQYEKAGIDSSYLDRVVLIENAVDVSTVFPKKNRLGNLTVLYVGRGSEEKRVHLVGKAAALCAAKGLPVQFVLVGDVKASIAAEDRKWCVFKGEISNPLEMKVLYDSADILVLVSKREGFPMAIMEAMAHAVVPVVTPVGGIPSHVRNGSNGVFLAEAAEEIPSSIVATLSGFCSSPESLDRMSRQAYEEAVASFSRTRFCRSYRELLEC